ncbi:MAG: MbnP family protein [Bacteroidota bacterium]
MHPSKKIGKTLLLCCTLIWTPTLWGQNDSLKIFFQPSFENAPLSLVEYDNTPPRGRQIEVFKCYLSNVALYDGDQLVFSEENSFHLLDAAHPTTLILTLNLPADLSYSSLQFNVGIDSLTSISGAFGGDLDPTKGMYWTWQSGYINFKLEGKADNCPARHHRFQFHIGGYQASFNALQSVKLELEAPRDQVQIAVDIDQLLNQIELSETYQVMSPNRQSVELAQFLPSLFSVLE